MEDRIVSRRYIAFLLFTLPFQALLLHIFVNAGVASIENGEIAISTKTPPNQAVTMNQASTEIMLALGLEKKLVGTAFMDDSIHPDFADAYEKIPVLAKKYPAKEVLLSVGPDFVYAGYASAFSARRGLAERQELEEFGIITYLSPSELKADQTPWSIELLYRELDEIAKIFHVEQRAKQLIAKIDRTLATIQIDEDPLQKPRILWLDAIDRDSPYVGTGYGAPNEIIRLAGGINVFADVSGGWALISKEQILDRPVDLIVLINANWDSAETKLRILDKDPLLQSLEAVKKGRFVIVDFSASTPGIRIPEAVVQLSHGIKRHKLQKKQQIGE